MTLLLLEKTDTHTYVKTVIYIMVYSQCEVIYLLWINLLLFYLGSGKTFEAPYLTSSYVFLFILYVWMNEKLNNNEHNHAYDKKCS